MMSLALAAALVERLQIDLNAAAVQRRVDAIDADERREAFHCRVLQNHVRQSLLASRHVAERRRLRRLRNAQNDAGILHREKALGHDDEEKDGDHQRGRPSPAAWRFGAAEPTASVLPY